MSMFENEQYCWRETYFVLFDAARRPKLEVVQKALAELNDRFAVTNLAADDRGLAESLTVLAPDDFAALDVCYVDGDEVAEQMAALAEELDLGDDPTQTSSRRQRLRRYNARFDVLHFEQVVDLEADEESDGMFDPTALLIVLEALAKLTDGIAVDPQAGTIL
jgi:hypothetical protein